MRERQLSARLVLENVCIGHTACPVEVTDVSGPPAPAVGPWRPVRILQRLPQTEACAALSSGRSFHSGECFEVPVHCSSVTAHTYCF